MSEDEQTDAINAPDLDGPGSSTEEDHDGNAPEFTEGDIEKGHVSEKAPGFVQRFFGTLTDKRFFISFFAGIIITGVALHYMPLKRDSAEMNESEDGYIGKITYAVSAPIGFNDFLSFNILVPFKETDEKKFLIEKLSNMRPELMRLAQDPDVAVSLKERNIDPFKEMILDLANRITEIPLTALEIKNLSLE